MGYEEEATTNNDEELMEITEYDDNVDFRGFYCVSDDED